MRKTALIAMVAAVSVWAMGSRADVKNDIRQATRAAKSYSGSTYRSEVKAKAEAAIDAYGKFASATNAYNEKGDLCAAALEAAASSYDLAFARPFAERIASDASAAPWARLKAVRYLALGDADRGDFAGAGKRAEAFRALPKVSPLLWAEAWALQAKMLTLQDDAAGAEKMLREAFRTIPAGAKNRAEYERFLQERLAAVLPAQKAFEYYVSLGRRSDALKIYDKGMLGDMAQAAALAKRMLTDEGSPFGDRLLGWTWLYNREPAFVDAHSPLRPGDRLKCTNEVASALVYKLTRARIYNLEGSATTVAYYGNRKEVIRTWNDYLKTIAATGAKPNPAACEAAVIAFAGEGDKKAAVAAARKGLENDALTDEQKYELALMAAVLPLEGSVDGIAAAIAKVEPTLAGKLDAKKRLGRFDRVGSAAVMTLDETLARGVAKYRARVSPDPVRKSYRVRFSPRNVAGAADWVNLPFKPEESAFDRKYGGGGDAFLATDVATGDRGEAVKGGEGTTTLQVVADSWGVHILRTFHDKRARDFERGFLDAGSFEEYIAPGDNQPYACLLVYPKKNAPAGVFQTAYDGEGCRRIDVKDPTVFRSDVSFTDDAVLVYTGISWNNYPLLVPTDGAAWEFESCFWGPNACAWNGLKTIHGRSSWGRLVFEMPEAARVKILEDQICQAAVRYRKEKVTRHGWEGIICHWQDPEVGDPAFYASRVKPLVDELDAVLERIRPEMTAEDVKDIAENHLRKFVDFRFIVARLRADYLHERL